MLLVLPNFVAGLLDATSAQVYSALAHHVSSESANTQRMKAVGVWSLQMTAEAVVGAVRAALLQGKVEPRDGEGTSTSAFAAEMVI